MRLTDNLNGLLRSVVVALALLVAFAPAGAQALTSVTGTVTDTAGEPLIGATVREKGTSNVTATDIDGHFTLKLASAHPTVEVSYIGYEPVKVRVTRSPLAIEMKSSESELDEVVVVAYGVQKKATVTGSIATVDSKEITKSSAPNVAAALSGKLPGLTTIQTNGAPGKDEVEMYLRGAATSNETKPLILVDGIPRESIREIDANEIETISVLKDASATAVFGVRGANGVILITTKRGQKGKMEVNATVRYSLQSFARDAYHRPSYDYARLLNEARANEGIAPEFQDYELALYDMWANGGSGPSDPELAYWFPNTDWSDIYFKDNASMVQANVNVSGGSDKLQYFVNAGYVYQGGMYNTEDSRTLGYDPQAKMNRYNLRANIDYQFSSWVKASIDVSSFIEKVNGTNGNEPSVWGDAITARTTAPYPLTPAGQYVRGDGTDANGNVILNPVRPGQVVLDPVQTLQSGYGNMNRSGYKLDTRSGVNAIATLNVDLGRLTEGLSLRGVVSFESRGTNTNTALNGFTTYKFERNPSRIKDPSD
ncbi:MAG: SusC/RagA family TonB-linked outer membrane protein, partial [Muribaculaceae bacterium]|nr:SusC/RagA family TonB-linked outer membrane protein [Muribaculaceae bacterium]